jgi:hypothetical protein
MMYRSRGGLTCHCSFAKMGKGAVVDDGKRLAVA